MSATRDFTKTIVLVAAGAGLATSPLLAQERPVVVYGEPEATRTVRISIADLDLASLAGANRLQARVGGAVKRVCLFESSIRLQPSDYYGCASAAWEDARPQIARVVARSQALAMSRQPAVAASAITISAR